MKHLLGVKELDTATIKSILKEAFYFKKQVEKKDPKLSTLLKNDVVANVFFEPSTRTRVSFEIAAKKLGASVINVLAESSSIVKGETIFDTLLNLEAMGVDLFILRHNQSGMPHYLSKYLKTPVINAGDGSHEHPTQALLDLMTIVEYKKNLKNLKVVIVGDILHSRVARSNIFCLSKFVSQVTLCSLPTLIPKGFSELDVSISYNLQESVKDADIIMVLRLQKERHEQNDIPSIKEYIKYCQLNEKLKFPKDALIMHPGPVNRNVEMSDGLYHSSQSVVLSQVRNGLPMRMALISRFLNKDHKKIKTKKLTAYDG
ncbi:MAG: aspartate carbamoyltransferase catalytic subunit [Deltaproteobacteria bacterium]|nr:aspartate carbamoyltransferase catalytic subunit [Deltaproteobacteria bacterium]